ncbi:MAG: hypothetical protein KDJ38_19240, partial [Gammaproteobacteria bacterium]|nr:hypothetical protein [Gammaproteobacteria bacterium]
RGLLWFATGFSILFTVGIALLIVFVPTGGSPLTDGLMLFIGVFNTLLWGAMLYLKTHPDT